MENHYSAYSIFSLQLRNFFSLKTPKSLISDKTVNPFFTVVIFLLLSCTICNAQEFERVWGTFYGPAGTDLGATNIAKLQFDSNNNLNFTAPVRTKNTYTDAYYNQFATSGTGYDNTKPINFIRGIVNNNGVVINTSYSGVPSDFEFSKASFNSNGDHFTYQYSSGQIAGGGTQGTWFPNFSTSGFNHILLSKHNSSGILQWKTYLPSSDAEFINEIIHDDLGNTFIIGKTFNTALATAGAFYTNYTILNGVSGPVPNPYIAKLNSSGQLVWATYFPAIFLKMRYYDGNLYILGASDLKEDLTQMSTANAFQSQKTNVSLTKLNAANGSRIWGTYYGPTGISTDNLASGIDVNETGLYILGDIIDHSGTTNNYFGTPGSFQSTSLGRADLYLTKFNHDGGRIWSTYFGSSSDELSSYNTEPLKVFGNDVFICGFQQVFPNNNLPINLATPGSHISSPPIYTGPTNFVYATLFFAKFSAAGTREWSSYYGGAERNVGIIPKINISVTDADTFYLHGSAASVEGFSTSGAAQPTGTNDIINGFLARFNRIVLSTTETSRLTDLILYDNPNNGIFTFESDILKKKNFTLNIYDLSGRLLHSEKMNKEKKQTFNYQGRLQTGTYSVQVSSGQEYSKNFKMIVK